MKSVGGDVRRGPVAAKRVKLPPGEMWAGAWTLPVELETTARLEEPPGRPEKVELDNYKYYIRIRRYIATSTFSYDNGKICYIKKTLFHLVLFWILQATS